MDQTVATVNGTPILERDLQTTMQSLASEQFKSRLEDLSEEAAAELKQAALERLIARELIYQAALEQGVVAADEEIEAEIARIQRQMGNPQDFWKRLESGGMDQASFLRMVRKDVTVERMNAGLLEKIPDPDEQDIRDFFSRHADQVKSPVTARIRHLLLPCETGREAEVEAAARELLASTEADNFAAVAKRHSACPSAAGGGDLGFVRAEELDPGFAETAFQLPVGEVGGPVRTPFGYHLLLVEEKRNPAPLTLETARPAIVKYLKRLEASRRLDEWVKKLREKAILDQA